MKILKSSMINDDSVIGSSSLVNKKFENGNVIIAGFPAKGIRNEITWNRKPPFACP